MGVNGVVSTPNQRLRFPLLSKEPGRSLPAASSNLGWRKSCPLPAGAEGGHDAVHVWPGVWGHWRPCPGINKWFRRVAPRTDKGSVSAGGRSSSFACDNPVPACSPA